MIGEAHKCPTLSLAIERREVTVDPPKDVLDYMRRFKALGKAASVKSR